MVEWQVPDKFTTKKKSSQTAVYLKHTNLPFILKVGTSSNDQQQTVTTSSNH